MPKGPYIPHHSLMALWPDISSNEINGLGEAKQRNPSYVYSGNDPSDIVYGDLQRWFYSIDPDHPGDTEERQRRAEIIASPLREIAKQKTPITEELIQSFYKGSPSFKAFDKIGVSQFNPVWAFEGVTIVYKNIVILGFQHQYDEIRKAPKPASGLKVIRQYGRAAFGSKYVANWLHGLGLDSEPLTGPMSGKVTMIPPAIALGFGELGKHGSIINPEFGVSFRLFAILTDCPLPLNEHREHGIDGFCENCRICETACPPNALFSEKKLVR